MPRVLLINPPIHDFAAYDFWARPLGLLVISGLLKKNGVDCDLVDLTDPLSPFLPSDQRPKRNAFGHGYFPKQMIEKPAALPPIRRRWSRYGLSPGQAKNAIAATQEPDAILIGSMMTYWYEGVFEAVKFAREAHPTKPILLGGVYATLCLHHAKDKSGADKVVPGTAEDALAALESILGAPLAHRDIADTSPAYSLFAHTDALPLWTSMGCPFSCLYCGVKALSPKYQEFSVERVMEEVAHITGRLGIKNLALYDDAFLADKKRALFILEQITALKRPISIHAASGLSCRGTTPDIALAMKKAGFKTLRIGLETDDPEAQKRLGGKATTDEFFQAVENLKSAGFQSSQIGAYVLAAMPGQSLAELEHAAFTVLDAGVRPHLSVYSPVPHSPLFSKAQEASHLDLNEPLNHNPTLMPCAGGGIDGKSLDALKVRISEEVRTRNILP